MPRRDITALIERMSGMETRCGVRLDGLFAFLDDEDGSLVVNGELQAVNGESIPHNIDLTAVVYDKAGRVLETETRFVLSENFCGFEVFSLLLSGLSHPVARLRLYPKPS